VRATLTAYFAAARRNDMAALAATLVPDYRYNGQTGAQFADQFDSAGGIRYHSLFYRIESLSVAGGAATALVTTHFQGKVNVEFLGLGRPEVKGTGRLAIDLEPRDGVWKVRTARIVRVTYAAPGKQPPTLVRFLVNGQNSVRVAPGAELTLSGESFGSTFLMVTTSENALSTRTNPSDYLTWRTAMKAPMAPGRYHVRVLLWADDFITLTAADVPVTVKDR
jgi:hypothetical protein